MTTAIDVMLSGLGGDDLCRGLRRTSDVPIIMVTARCDSHYVVAAVDVHVRRLRRKIEDDPAHPRHLVTVRSLGYKLQP